jgi:ABC-2 type transport system ATP-binding protein
MTSPLAASGLVVRLGTTRALDNVSLQAAPGAVTAVVGGDGAGKSTLLRCLAGAMAPDSGTVAGPGPMATGYLPASSGTYPDLTVAENLAFRATAYSLRGHAATQRAAELMEWAGLTDARDRLAGQLSGGMRQKLGVIAAMLHRPRLLVLDEPTTGVDPVSRSGLWLLIASAAADGAAVVLSTSYLDEAQRASLVLALDAGRELASGTPEEIVAAMPGEVLAAPGSPGAAAGRFAWRRAGRWRVWIPPGSTAEPGTGERVAADMQDAVTVAALRRELASEGDAPGSDPAQPAGQAALPARGSAPAVLAECAGVTCRFGAFTAVREVSVQIGPGEIVGLLGANGAGKTTLIRMLLGLQRPSAGHVMLLGEPPSRQTRQRIGYVPQGLGLYDDLTAAQNMQFATAVFRGLRGSPPGLTQRVPDRGALPEDIARRAGVPVGQLPLGQQRRAAFAQALSHRPDLLVLDEPTSGVDPLGRARLWDTIARAAGDGAGVLVSTHYLEEASECDRLIVMAGGVVVASGTEAEITGGAQVTVVDADDWAEAFSRLAVADLPVALAGRLLRVPGSSVAAVRAALGDERARVFQAPATLEERFFELVGAGAGQQAAV